jgi:hypothetical protein
MGKQAIQRPRHPREVQRVDEQPRVPVLAAAAGAHEAPELLLEAASSLGRLVLEGAERPELALALDHLLHGGAAEAADQLVLQVGDADVEPERRHLGPAKVRAQTGPLQTAPEVDLLPGVTEARQVEVQPPGTEQLQEPSDAPGAAHRDDADPLGGKVPSTACGQGLERHLVADPLDEHDRPRIHAGGQPSSADRQRPGGCGPASLLVVHLPTLAAHRGRPGVRRQPWPPPPTRRPGT